MPRVFFCAVLTRPLMLAPAHTRCLNTSAWSPAAAKWTQSWPASTKDITLSLLMISNYVASARARSESIISLCSCSSFIRKCTQKLFSANISCNNGMNGPSTRARFSNSKFSESRWRWDKNSNLAAEGKRKTTITITGAVFLAALWSTWMHSGGGECLVLAANSKVLLRLVLHFLFRSLFMARFEKNGLETKFPCG